MYLNDRGMEYYAALVKLYFFHDATALVSQGVSIVKVYRTHPDTPHSVDLLWTGGQPDVETST